MILDKIKTPEDLKKLGDKELEKLAEEIREFLVENVSKTGGHLASNLGVVELTIAIHKCFNLPEDKIVWDVGHQSYVHKILTGRREGFKQLRKFGGMSGFPKRTESSCDCFNTGHSSTSISAALGIARGRDLQGDKYNVLAVFGDGALTGGMMYEALNDAGHSKTKFIAVLNDNAMSISKNVGAISRHLRILRSKPAYFRSKRRVENALNHIPIIGKSSIKVIRKIKRSLKRIVLSNMFDNLGFEYLGPIDGHNIKALTAVFEQAKTIDKPVFIHVHTKKGKGYAPAEKNPQMFHGVSEFDAKTGNTLSESKKDYSAVFGEKLVKMARENKSIAAITPAMPAGSGLLDYAAEFPDRFFDVGIAEPHALTLAAGLAVSGTVPVAAVYSSFLQRAYDQILHDICLQGLHVVIPVDRAGIVGADGETHQGMYDMAFLAHMPNMSILAPSNFRQLEQMLDYAVNVHNAPIAIRYPRGNKQSDDDGRDFQFGKANVLHEGSDITITAVGRMVAAAQEVCAALTEKGISPELIELATVKPIDEDTLIKSVFKTGKMITIEDGVKIGGVGERIAAVLKEKDISCKFRSFAFADTPITHGTVDELDKLYGLDKDTVEDFVIDFVK